MGLATFLTRRRGYYLMANDPRILHLDSDNTDQPIIRAV